MDVRCSAEELIATLERTSLTTIVVEGVDDMRRYRWIEDVIPNEVSVLQAGGRDVLLKVFEHRNRFHVPVAFIADKDMWMFSHVPTKYSDIVFTTGFSIENDILESGVVLNLFSKAEIAKLNWIEDELAKWYAFEVSRYINGLTYKIDYHPKRLLDNITFRFVPTSILPRIFEEPPKDLQSEIRSNFGRSFRGKNLLDLYEYVFQQRKDQTEGVKHSKEALIEMSAKCGSSDAVRKLISGVKSKLSYSKGI